MLRRIFPAAVLASLLAGCLNSLGIGAETLNESTVLRVGTFDRTPLLVAYYQSSTHLDWLDELRLQHDDARAEDDAARAQAIEEMGRKSQDIAHRQLTGSATLGNVLEQCRDALPRIAQEAGVDVIVEQPWFMDRRVQVVDVTEDLVALFTPPEIEEQYE
ncbi:MAG: hypothetical protein ACYTHJ_00765 [Planctomycetota bacterium]